MPFIDIVERKGIEEGRQERLEKGRLEGIEALLEVKFGKEGRKLLPEIRQVQDPKVLRAIKTASTPDEVRQVWTEGRRPKKAKRTS